MNGILFISSLLRILAVLLGMMGALAVAVGAVGIAIARLTDDALMRVNATRWLLGGICLLALCAMLRTPVVPEILANIIVAQ